jgi:competence protein ComEC
MWLMSGRGIEPVRPYARRGSAGVHARSAPHPLLWPTVAFMAGIWLAELVTPGRPVLIVAALSTALAFGALVLGLAFLRRGGDRARRRAVAMLILVIATGAGILRHQAAVAKPENHVTHLLGDEPLLTRLVGDVASTPYATAGEHRNPFIPFDPPSRTQFVIAARELRTVSPPAPVCGRIRVTVDGEGLGLGLGDRVQLTGRLYRPSPPRNPGEFDWARWNYLQGVEAGMVVEGPEHVRRIAYEPGWLAQAVASARLYAHLLLLGPYGDEPPDAAGRLLDTLVLGQRSAADRELNEAFLRAGGLHFLAVSGFNVAVLAGATCWVMRGVLRRSARATALVTLAAVLSYALVAEPNAPIVRATVLGVLVALSGLTGRRAIIWNGLAAGALGVLAVSPLELFRPGFQLSFIQVMALIMLVPRVCSRNLAAGRFDRPQREADTWGAFVWMRLRREAWGLAALCMVAWLVATPLVLFHYGRLAPWGILGTMLLTGPVVLITWLGVLTIAVQALYPPGAVLVGTTLQWLSNALLALVHWFADHVRPGVIELANPPLALVLGTYALVVIALTVSGRVRPDDLGDDFRSTRAARRRAVAIWSGTLGLLALAWLGWYAWPQRARTDYELHVLSVGSGNTVMMLTPTRGAVLFDVGTDRNVDAGELASRAARALGVRQLAGIAISHANFDHCSGLPSVLEKLPAGALFLSEHTAHGHDSTPAVEQTLKLPERRELLQRVGAGDAVSLAGMTVEVLWPPHEIGDAGWNANDLSLVLRVQAGARRILITGDIDGRAMRELLAADASGTIRLASDVLVAPHHGSVVPESGAFYGAVKPQLVLVSSAEDRPKLTALLSRVLGTGARCISTARRRAVTVVIRPDGDLRVTTPVGRTASGPDQD